MKVIKKGNMPSKRLYKGLCNHCNSEVEATQEEVKRESHLNEEHYTALCPVCKEYGVSTTINFAQTDKYAPPLGTPSTPVYRNTEPGCPDTGGHPRLP